MQKDGLITVDHKKAFKNGDQNKIDSTTRRFTYLCRQK